MNKRVCHISTVHGAGDTRIFHKMCVSLAKNDWEVHWVVKNGGNSRLDGVQIHGIPSFSSRLLRMTLGVLIAFFKTLFINPKIVHFHDPELIPVGLLFSILGKKVIYDMHELTYHQLGDKLYLGKGISRIQVLYQWMERRGMKSFAAVILAEDGYQSYMDQEYPEYRSKVYTVRNFPDLSKIDEVQPAARIDKDRRVVYAGGLTRIRGIKELIVALEGLENTRLTLMGPWGSDEFRKECESLLGYGQVDYLGTVTFEEVIAQLKSSEVGVAVLYPQENYKTSRPVKVYEYMACGVAAVISDFDTWQNSFGDTCWYAGVGDIVSIQNAIRDAMDSQQREDRTSLATQRLREEWNWGKEQEVLLDLYERLL